MPRWPWSKRDAASSPAEALQRWDGAYRWGGPVPNEGHQVRFGVAGSLHAPDDLLDALKGLSGGRVSRSDALRVTAVLRARNLIGGVPATLPIELRDRKTRELDDRLWLGEQPDPWLEPTVTYSSTYEDLLFEGKSYWRVTRWGEGGYPVEGHHLDIRAVTENAITSAPSRVISPDLPFAPMAPVFVDGLPTMEGEIIRFTSPNPPLLTHAASAIRTVLLLDKIAADYATDPLPFGYFTDASDEDPLEDDEINAVLDQWEAARRRRRWGYVESGLELKSLEWPNPEELQLVQARNHAVLDIARATGLDPEDAGVTLQGVSRTYQNAEQRRLDLVDFTLTPYMKVVTERLSMRDVTPRSVFAQYDTAAFTRADFMSRMEAYKTGVESGVMEPNDGRRREGWPDRATPQRPPAPPPPVPSNGNGSQNNAESMS